jgi:hypothetical protein
MRAISKMNHLPVEKTKGGRLTDAEVRRKDAIYFAFAIASDSLAYHKLVSLSTFQRLLAEHLINDVKNPDPRLAHCPRSLLKLQTDVMCQCGDLLNVWRDVGARFKLVRRRVAQIIENWSREIHKAPSIMPMVYQFLMALMGDADVVVRLAATIAFKIGILLRTSCM